MDFPLVSLKSGDVRGVQLFDLAEEEVFAGAERTFMACFLALSTIVCSARLALSAPDAW